MHAVNSGRNMSIKVDHRKARRKVDSGQYLAIVLVLCLGTVFFFSIFCIYLSLVCLAALLIRFGRSLRTRANENASKMEIFKKAGQVLTY